MPNPLDPMDGMWRTRRPRPAPRRPVPPHVWAAVAAVIVAAVLAMGVLALTGARPHPTPTPPPSPVSGTIWVTLVYDADAPGLDFARLETEQQAMDKGVADLGGHLRKFASDSPVLDEKGLRQYVKKYGTPTLIIQAEGVSKVVAKPCPKTAAEVVNEAKAFKGGRS
jgi:hypothetical protein